MYQVIDTPEQCLLQLYQAGLAAVEGDSVTARALQQSGWAQDIPLALFACGKAAPAMAQGASKLLGSCIQHALLVTKRGYLANGWPEHWQCIEAGHPLPDAASLEAGRQLLALLETLPDGMPLLALISGGTSALLELLPAGVSLADLQRVNDWLLASGAAIEDMNRVRSALSCLKGGRLRGYIGHRPVLNLMISDVRGDVPSVIGSGPLSNPPQEQVLPPGLPTWLMDLLKRAEDCPAPARPGAEILQRVVATNQDACQAIARAARERGLPVCVHEPLFSPVDQVSIELAKFLSSAPPGVHVWGGEPTLKLPEQPGRGGRNQHLALSLSVALQGSSGIHVLCGATDGSDGPGEDAGALVDENTATVVNYPGGAAAALARADSGTFLDEAGALISTGPTGTNVMDLVIALKTVG
ncbi:MAG: DUF4147 domain-containing protein [Thiohalophilus sp.]